jgi:TRAP-type C4-dicarboxylate transport system permease large subunit
VGAFTALLMALLTRSLTWKNLVSSIMDAGRFSAMVFLIVIGAIILMYFLAMSGIPTALAELAIEAALPPLIVVGFMILVYMLLGCIMPMLGMILLTIPVFYPVILHLGFDPIWFGIIVTHIGEIALITPPIGVNVYVISGVAPDVPMEQIFRGIIPFLISDVIVTVFLVFFPQISIWLPSMMY